MVNIHPTAIVDSEAKIGENVSIGPFSIIEKNVIIGDGTEIASHAVLLSGARVGKECRIFKGAVLGTVPQDLKFGGEETTLEIGDKTTIREFCTLNRGTEHRLKTVIGSNCLLMAYVHVAHDCLIGDNVIIANAVNMAGHVTIESNVGIGGMSPIHQFVKIGQHSFVGGGLRISKDIPPYILAAGEPVKYAGVNHIGLSRRGFSKETLAEIRRAYKIIYRSGNNITQAITQLKASGNLLPEVQNVVDFIASSERGVIK